MFPAGVGNGWDSAREATLRDKPVFPCRLLHGKVHAISNNYAKIPPDSRGQENRSYWTGHLLTKGLYISTGGENG
jgi:hypothetical protein